MIRAAALALGLMAACASAASAGVVVAKGGSVRVLDRLTGAVTDYDLAPGEVQEVGKLSIRLDECRYPDDTPSEAYAHLTISDTAQVEPVFKGWMIASSPGLNALDHPRYDVWVLHCDVPAAAQAPADSTNSGSGSGG